MQRHEENAAAIANALNGHPLVRRVYFPGLTDHPGHDIARRQMSGFGGMVSFELDGTMDEVVSFVSSRRYFTLAESLGGVKALICHPATMTHASIPAGGARGAWAFRHADSAFARLRKLARPGRGFARRAGRDRDALAGRRRTGRRRGALRTRQSSRQ